MAKRCNNAKHRNAITHRINTNTTETFKEIKIDNKTYWIPEKYEFRDVLPGSIICERNQSTYSDHDFMMSYHRIKGLLIGTFNACCTPMALRGLQKIHNATGQWRGYITGDRFTTDTQRKEYVADYIFNECIREGVQIILLQEVDNELCEFIRRKEGCSVEYLEEPNSVNGGNAICTIGTDVRLDNPTKIHDSWTNKKGITCHKLVGIKCVATYGDTQINIASCHFDESTTVEFIIKIFENLQSQTIIGGDFNRNVCQYEKELNDKINIMRITPNDKPRQNSNLPTIDGIFCVQNFNDDDDTDFITRIFVHDYWRKF